MTNWSGYSCIMQNTHNWKAEEGSGFTHKIVWTHSKQQQKLKKNTGKIKFMKIKQGDYATTAKCHNKNHQFHLAYIDLCKCMHYIADLSIFI